MHDSAVHGATACPSKRVYRWLATPSHGILSLVLVALVALPAYHAQDKKNEKKTEPALLVSVPLAATPGRTVKLTLRGHHLDQAKEVKLSDGASSAKILNKGKSDPPDTLPPEKFGDTHVEIELTLGDKATANVNLRVVTEAGETKPYSLLIDSRVPLVPDKEGNDGFREAQPVKLPAVVDGKIERQRDVDVFRIEGKAGQKLVAEVFAARHGSALDGVLTLYTAEGNQAATSDDHGGSFDPRIETVLPRDGVYYVALIDAHDTGGALHLYRLRLE